MPESFPIAQAQDTTRSRSTVKLASLKLLVLHFLRPRVLPVLALALMAAGWSYGLKLSHYLRHTDVTKASSTRLWLDHRNEATVAADSRHQVQDKFHTPPLSGLGVRALPPTSWQQLLAVPAPAPTADFVLPLHPLRAPPLSLPLA